MRLALAVPWLLFLAAACTGDDPPAAPPSEATLEATPSPTAAPSAVPTATPQARALAWAAGETIQLSAEPVTDVRIVELTERLEDGALDDQRDSLLYDLQEDRLFLVEGAYIHRFVPGRTGERPAAAASKELSLSSSTLLIWVEPLEVETLPVLMNVRPPSLEPPFRGKAEVGLPQARAVEGRVAPEGVYSFDVSSLEILPVWRQGDATRSLPDIRWEPPIGPPIIVESERPPGGTRQRATLTRQGVIIVDAMQAHWTSPDGTRIAVVGNGSELMLVDVLSGDIRRIGFSAGYRQLIWSPSNRYLAVQVSGPFGSSPGSAYVLDLERVPGPIEHSMPPTLGPFEGRGIRGWLSDTELLMLARAAGPGDDRPVEVLDVEREEVTRFTIDETQLIWTFELSPLGDRFMTSTFDRSMGLWSTRGGSRLIVEQLEGVALGILDASWSSDGRWLALSPSLGRS